MLVLSKFLSRFVRSAAPLVSAVASFVAPSNALGYCRTHTCSGVHCQTDEAGCPSSGRPLVWPSSCVPVFLNPRGIPDIPNVDTVQITLERALSAWSDVRCARGKVSIQLALQGNTRCSKAQGKHGQANANIVFFRENDWKYAGVDGTLATTTVSFSADSGQIFDADIAINSANNSFSEFDRPAPDEFSLESVLVHELGHFIGLAHSSKSDAIMQPQLPEGSPLKTLSTDDVEGVCEVYDPSRNALCRPAPEGVVEDCEDPDAPASASCSARNRASGSSGGNLCFAAMLGVAVAIARWRNRRRAV